MDIVALKTTILRERRHCTRTAAVPVFAVTHVTAAATMMATRTPRPRFLEADHVSWTVPDLDAAVRFYCEVFGAVEIFRLGPLDAEEMPRGPDGRDWMESHVNVRGAKLSLVMLKLTSNLNFQLVQYDKPADRRGEPPRNCDVGGHHIGLKVDDVSAAAAYLKGCGCTVMETIVIDAGPLAGHKNLYVVDPWGLHLEIID